MNARCPCCGQAVAAASVAAPTIWVEEAVLALCNRAYARAEEAGAAEVELRHVVEVMDESPAAAMALADFGLDRGLLVAAARRMPLSGLAGSGERPRTSDALRTLLQRAEVRARTGGLQSVTLQIFLAALLIDMRDSRAASFVSHDVAQRAALSFTGPRARDDARGNVLQLPYPSTARDASREREEAARKIEPRALHAGDMAATRDRGPAARGGRDDGELGSLLGRFDAQSRLLAQLQRQIEALSTEFGIPSRSHRRFFRKRRSSSSLSRYFRRKSLANGSGTRAPRTRTRQAEAREPVGLLEADAVEPEIEDDTDDDTPLTARPKRFYLALDDEIVKAPSIGPRTASKLIAVGVTLVRDLLLADADELAAALQTRYITPQRIAAWQAQARLVCTIPWLRGTHAQMLVGAGFDTLDKVQTADRDALCAAVTQFAGTRDGQSVLRSGAPPESARIIRWAEFAQLAERDRAGTHAYRH